ncbi:MAG: intradiol ring-cleavage dioxygenase [Flammeovirgaceae bacterium]|nr:intradiol ring-cleavage dioxygenase [Flammeovirgaceae bacterium]
MKYCSIVLVAFLFIIGYDSNGQDRLCEDCKGLYEYDRSKELMATDTLPVYREGCKNKMIVSGTAFKPDGITPAPGVIIYIYHTNEKGKYPTKGKEKGMAKEHGYNRSWVKTGQDGKYSFVTCKPGHYPSGRDAAHIHVIIKEPDKQEYWIGDYLFEGDTRLTQTRIDQMRGRGGNGVIRLTTNDKGELQCYRDIFLGRNIPDYK